MSIPTTDGAWAAFVAASDAGARTEILDALRVAIEAVEAAPPGERARFVDNLCAAEVDTLAIGGSLGQLWREPLISSVVLPVLKRRAARDEPHAARRLALVLLASGALGSRRVQEQLDTDPLALLDDAIRVDPQDRAAMRWKRRQLAEGLDYVMHELPSGLLASSDEIRADCDAMEIINHALQEGGWEAELDFWRSHADLYEKYLTQTPRSSAYADVLAAAGLSDQLARNTRPPY